MQFGDVEREQRVDDGDIGGGVDQEGPAGAEGGDEEPGDGRADHAGDVER